MSFWDYGNNYIIQILNLSKIYLNFEGINRAYELLGVMPKEDKLYLIREIIAPLAAHPWALEESTQKRIVSQNLFRDSKYFEKRVEGRLVSLLRRIYPEELDRDEDYLDQVGIVNNPKLTLISGHLVVKMDLDFSSLPGGIGLSAELIKELVIQAISAKTILLIENLTTYYEVLRMPEILPPPVLVIYTGGFPHKSTQKLLRKIAGFLADRHENHRGLWK